MAENTILNIAVLLNLIVFSSVFNSNIVPLSSSKRIKGSLAPEAISNPSAGNCVESLLYETINVLGMFKVPLSPFGPGSPLSPNERGTISYTLLIDEEPSGDGTNVVSKYNLFCQ